MGNSITVGLQGGLGNQMFQYAMGRSLALRNNLSLELDVSPFQFDTYYKRTYELHYLNISDHTKIVCRPHMYRITRVLVLASVTYPPLASIGGRWFILGQCDDFDESLCTKAIKNAAYVLGFWQDERYFKEIQSVLRKEFTLKAGFSEANQILAKRILQVNAVSLHTRRLHGVASAADAKPTSDAEKQGIALGTPYYDKALEIIREEVPNPVIFVFSDYPAWARKGLRTDLPTHVFDNTRGRAHEDLWLMALCKHHIIANSSFSWWGAWLAASPGQIVIAPSGAIASPTIPNSWRCLK